MIGSVVVSYNWQDALSNLLGSLRKELASQGNPVIGDALVDDKTPSSSVPVYPRMNWRQFLIRSSGRSL